MFYQNATQVTAFATKLAVALQMQGSPVPVTTLLETLSLVQGFEGWCDMQESFKEGAVNAGLSQFELNHAVDAADADIRAEDTGMSGYGYENKVLAHTGFTLNSPSYPEDCDYVRVCDPLGREVGYWLAEEVQEDPAFVLGAIIGALTRGDSFEGVTSPVSYESVDNVATEKVALIKNVCIQDVDFNRINAVVISGDALIVRVVHGDVLELLTENNLTEDERDQVALELHRDDEGLMFEEQMTLGQLMDLTWDASKKRFFSAEAGGVEFYVEINYAEYLELTGK